MDTIHETLMAVFQEIFDDESINLRPDLTAAEIPEWDSLNHVRLILAVQRTFSIKFSAAQTANLKNVGELIELIRKKKAHE